VLIQGLLTTSNVTALSSLYTSFETLMSNPTVQGALHVILADNAISSAELASLSSNVTVQTFVAQVHTLLSANVGILGLIDMASVVSKLQDIITVDTENGQISATAEIPSATADVMIDLNETTGAYEITNPYLATLPANTQVEVNFDYTVTDSAGASDDSTAAIIITTADINNAPITSNMYLKSELSDETIDGTRILTLDTNINTNTTDVDLKIYVDGATAASTMIIGDTVLTAVAAKQPDNVEITEDGFIITTGVTHNSFVAPSLEYTKSFYTLDYNGSDYTIGKNYFNNGTVIWSERTLDNVVFDSETITLSDENDNGYLEGTGDELSFSNAIRITTINGIDVSAYLLKQVDVTFTTISAVSVEETTDWWDASWLQVNTLDELVNNLTNQDLWTRIFTEDENVSFKLNTDSSIYNNETNEIVAGNWSLTTIAGIEYLVVNLEDYYTVAYKLGTDGLEMTEIGIPGITTNTETWYYGDVTTSQFVDLINQAVDAVDTLVYPEYDESAPADYYFAFGDPLLVEEALNNEITITNVETEVNVITQLNSNGSNIELMTISGDNTFTTTDGDDTITLDDNIKFIDGQEGDDTLDLSGEDTNIDLSSLLQNVSIYNIENIDMTSSNSPHILSNFTLDEFISLTDEDNTLKILGDAADHIELDSAQNWTQMMASDGTTPYTDPDGFHVYTTNTASETLKLLIQDTVTVENI
jgi:hypothetical protein